MGQVDLPKGASSLVGDGLDSRALHVGTARELAIHAAAVHGSRAVRHSVVVGLESHLCVVLELADWIPSKIVTVVTKNAQSPNEPTWKPSKYVRGGRYCDGWREERVRRS